MLKPVKQIFGITFEGESIQHTKESNDRPILFFFFHFSKIRAYTCAKCIQNKTVSLILLKFDDTRILHGSKFLLRRWRHLAMRLSI